MSTHSKWVDVCDSHLIKHLLVGKQLKSNGLPFLGMALAWIIGALAMAGPAWNRLPQPAHDVLEGRVIVFDLSLSMDSSDVQPTRLQRARYKLTDLILAGSELQQGLVVFAGDAFIVTPLTDDTDTLINLVPSLTTNTVPVQGSRADLGIEIAATLIRNTGLDEGNIILITDGVSADTEKSAARISSTGLQVSVMAVGTMEGAPIQLANGELLKDSGGNIVIPRVDHNELRQVALAGKGKYVELSVNSSDLDELAGTTLNSLDLELSQSLFLETETSKFRSDQWKDSGPWLVLPLLIIVALGFRRGWILTIAFLALPLTPEIAHAFSWEDLWLRSDQRAARHFREGKYDQIQEHDPVEWRGAAKYRSGDYVGAIGNFSVNDADNATAHYNRGNAMVKSGSLQESLAAYDRALDVDPDMEDAKFNKDLVENLLKQQEQQSSPRDQNADNTEKSNTEKGSENPTQTGNQQFDQQNQQESTQTAGNENPDTKSTQDNSSEGMDDVEPENIRADQAEPLQQKNKDPVTDEDVPNQGETAEKLQVPMSEQQQALEQWLQRIPDDPGGLLRRKFAHQYSLRQHQTHSERW